MSAPLPAVAILAGGLATRLRPLTEQLPKSLIPVAGRPFLTHQLELLRSQGIQRVVLCVGHLGEQIEATFGDGRPFDLDLAYSYDGENLAGTAGALRRALPLLGDHFFTLYGDSYLRIDYRSVWQMFLNQSAPVLMTVLPCELATDPPNAWYEAGHVKAYGKGAPLPEMRHVDYGLSLFSARLFRADERDAELPAVQSRLAAAGQLAGYEATHRYFEIGSHQGLADLESYLRTRA